MRGNYREASMPLLTAFVKRWMSQDLSCGIIPKKLVRPQNAPECGANRGDFQSLGANLVNPADLRLPLQRQRIPTAGVCLRKSFMFRFNQGLYSKRTRCTSSARLGSNTNCYVMAKFGSALIVQLPTCSALKHLASYARSCQGIRDASIPFTIAVTLTQA